MPGSGRSAPTKAPLPNLRNRPSLSMAPPWRRFRRVDPGHASADARARGIFLPVAQTLHVSSRHRAYELRMVISDQGMTSSGYVPKLAVTHRPWECRAAAYAPAHGPTAPPTESPAPA